jgi:hypothetical protein
MSTAFQSSELRSIAHTVERSVLLHTALKRAAQPAGELVTNATHNDVQAKATPPSKGELDELKESLGARQHALLKQLQAFMDSKGAPSFKQYWGEITADPHIKTPRIGAARPSAGLRTTAKTAGRTRRE